MILWRRVLVSRAVCATERAEEEGEAVARTPRVRCVLVSVGDLATDLVVRIGASEIDPVSDTPAAVSRHRGGAAANVAAVSARLGRACRFVGAVGADDLATAASDQLRSLGVEVTGPVARRGWSIVVLVDPAGGRRFLTDTGDVDPWGAPQPGWLAGASRVHFSGYALCDDRSTETCRQLAVEARRLDVPVSVDPSSRSVVERFGVDRFVALLDELRPDVVFPNEDEADLVGPSPAWRWTVVTRGAQPTTVFDPEGRRLDVPVAPVAVVDTTGAGDAFAAGFLAAWDGVREIERAVAAGHAAAACVVGAPGADAWQAPSP